MDKIQEEIKF